MAEGGADLSTAFGKFATKADKKECTTKDITRWCTDSCVFGKNCNSNHLDIAFSKCKTKGKTTVTCAQMDGLIGELSKMYLKDHKCDEATAKTQIREKMAGAEPKAHGATKQSKTGGVNKMTDATKYTGAHKERFDEDGKGKGVAGRKDEAKNDGYVGAYKDKDTFDKKNPKK